MNRRLLVTLLHKNIEELGMITESLMEPGDLPQAIILLAKRKTEDIQTILGELSVSAVDNDTPAPATDATTFVQEEKMAEIENQTANFEETTIAPEPDTQTYDDNTIITPPTATPVEEVIVMPTEDVEDEIILPIAEFEPEAAEDEVPGDIINIEDLPVTPDTEIVNEAAEQESEPIQETIQETSLHENKVMTIADKIATQSGSSRNETMSTRDNSLSASIANKKVTDIKQAISIGDRFRFQRELFRSNGEDMNKTLTYLNLLATLDEAMAFLNSKYGWTPENQAAEDFYQIVRRKFL